MSDPTTWLRRSGVEIAAAIRRGETTSRAVVEAHIARIQRVNPIVNALVQDRFAQARDEADEADRRLRSDDAGALPPLHGVPCTVKECFAMTDMPQTSGLVSRRGVVSDHDAPTVTRLREAGCIPLGVTNLSELCMWMESDNRVYGRTNNPYDPTRTAGGSSGGEGAIVGAGGSPFGLGADIGGSIRMPAFFGGVFGHKPTGGLVPQTDHYPEPENEARRYNTVGPLARRADDLYPVLKVLAGPDGIDPGCRDDIPLGDPEGVDVSTLHVLDVADDGGRTYVADDLRAAQRRVADHLRSMGCRVERTRIESLRYGLEIWATLMSAADERSFAALLGGGEPIRVLPEFARWMLRQSPHTLPALGLAAIEKIPDLVPGGAERMSKLGRELKAELVDKIGDDGVMLYPPYAEPAPKHRRALWPPVRWVYTALINVMELPSTVVPLGLNDDGVPLGVQVIGVHGNDHVTIAVARELERAFGGWVFPDHLGEGHWRYRRGHRVGIGRNRVAR